jgi:hypothetical protein
VKAANENLRSRELQNDVTPRLYDLFRTPDSRIRSATGQDLRRAPGQTRRLAGRGPRRGRGWP